MVRACFAKLSVTLLKTRETFFHGFWNGTTDEESNATSLTVNEKQTGVRFDGVRKVFNTDQGEIVAVDDFTLKLSEGEVTSLLGRNGAGKTTIMYVSSLIYI